VTPECRGVCEVEHLPFGPHSRDIDNDDFRAGDGHGREQGRRSSNQPRADDDDFG
jgi:hypothetical protein